MSEIFKKDPVVALICGRDVAVVVESLAWLLPIVPWIE